MKADCPSKDEKCSLCGFWGHLSNKCQRSDGNGNKGKGKGKGKDAFMSSAQAIREAPQNAQCYACGGYGHSKSACQYASSMCDFCGRVGHTQAMCHAAGNGPAKQSAAPGIYVSAQDDFAGSEAPAQMGARSCYACGEYGHSKSACPYASGTCEFCGKLGHTQAMCHAAGNGPSKQAGLQAMNTGFQMPSPTHGAMAIVQNINAKDQSHSHAQCYACGEHGHAKAACPYASGACDFCGKTGHTQAMCHAAGNGPAKQSNLQPVKGGSKGGSQDGQCYACGEFGHSKAACPYASGTCEFCGKLGHTQAMCHAAGNGPAKQSASLEGAPEARSCYACGEYGHSKSACPYASGTCEFCGKLGHTQAMCHAAGNGPARAGSVASQDGATFGASAIMQNLNGKDQVRIDQARSNAQCYACGGFGHTKAACPYASSNCEFCGKLGHTQEMCHAAGKGPQRG